MKFYIAAILLVGSIMSADYVARGFAQEMNADGEELMAEAADAGDASDSGEFMMTGNGNAAEMMMAGNGDRVMLADGEASYMSDPNVYTSRSAAPTRVVTQRVRIKPRIITKTEVDPIKRVIISEPSLMRERYTVTPRFVKSAPQFRSNPAKTAPTQYTQSTVRKPVTLPANIEVHHPIIQPVLHEREQVIKILSAPDIRRTNSPIVKPTKYTTSNSTKVVNVPPQQIYTQKFIQPTLRKEKVNIQIVDQPAQYHNHKPTTNAVIHKQTSRTQNVDVPGAKYYYQRIMQPSHTEERVQVKIVKSDPIYKTRPTITKPATRSKTVKHLYKDVVHNVPDVKWVHVKEPVVHRVAVEKYVPSPINIQQTRTVVSNHTANVHAHGGFASNVVAAKGGASNWGYGSGDANGGAANWGYGSGANFGDFANNSGDMMIGNSLN